MGRLFDNKRRGTELRIRRKEAARRRNVSRHEIWGRGLLHFGALLLMNTLVGDLLNVFNVVLALELLEDLASLDLGKLLVEHEHHLRLHELQQIVGALQQCLIAGVSLHEADDVEDGELDLGVVAFVAVEVVVEGRNTYCACCEASEEDSDMCV